MSDTPVAISFDVAKQRLSAEVDPPTGDELQRIVEMLAATDVADVDLLVDTLNCAAACQEELITRCSRTFSTDVCNCIKAAIRRRPRASDKVDT